MDNRQAEFSKISHVYTEYKTDNRQAELSKISPAYTEYKMDNTVGRQSSVRGSHANTESTAVYYL
jgi:hypothetical protein